MNTLISRDIITMDNVSMATSLLIGHLRSGGQSMKTPSHPEPVSHNRSSSIDQCSWKGGEGSPGRCSREEGQHRRIHSSGNHKSLQWRGLKGGMDWSHPSGRKSSACMAPSILQQLGELLDKPVDIIPGKMFGGILEILSLDFKSAHLELYHNKGKVQKKGKKTNNC